MAKPKQKTFIEEVKEKFLPSAIGTIFSLLLSIGLVSGSSYILLGANAELIELDRIVLEFSQFNAEEDRLYALHEDASLVYDPQFVAKVQTITSYISSHKNDQVLDQKFRDETINWYSDTVIKLSAEKGKVSGYVFADQVYQTYQAGLKDLYAAQLLLLDQIAEMIYYWDKEDVTARENRFSGMIISSREAQEKYGSSLVTYEQIIKKFEYESELLTQVHNENIQKIRLARTRLILAWSGIILGAAALIAVIGLTIKTFVLRKK